MHDPNHHEEVQVEIEELQVSPTIEPQHMEIPLYLALPDPEEQPKVNQLKLHSLPRLESNGTLHEVSLLDNHQILIVKPREESIPPRRSRKSCMWIGLLFVVVAIVTAALIVMLIKTSATSSSLPSTATTTTASANSALPTQQPSDTSSANPSGPP
jgi:hypothetical protein